MAKLHVHLDSFEGPLDLLLYLIQSHELDISKVSISQMTNQYLQYVQLMQELNFDIASEFLVMAATLLHWKSRALLPQEEKVSDPTSPEGEVLSQEQLVKQLLEHQQFLEAGRSLSKLPKLGEDVFTRSNKKPPVERIWRDMSLTDLALGYQESLVRASRRTHVLQKETVSITEKIQELLQKLPVAQLIELRSVLHFPHVRPEIVATFLASLELARMKKLKLYQEGTYQAIYLELLETFKIEEIRLASFEYDARTL